MGQGDFLAQGQNCEFLNDKAIVTSKVCLPGNAGIKQKEWLISQGGSDLGEVLEWCRTAFGNDYRDSMLHLPGSSPGEKLYNFCSASVKNFQPYLMKQEKDKMGVTVRGLAALVRAEDHSHLHF